VGYEENKMGTKCNQAKTQPKVFEELGKFVRAK